MRLSDPYGLRKRIVKPYRRNPRLGNDTYNNTCVFKVISLLVHGKQKIIIRPDPKLRLKGIADQKLSVYKSRLMRKRHPGLDIL